MPWDRYRARTSPSRPPPCPRAPRPGAALLPLFPSAMRPSLYSTRAGRIHRIGPHAHLKERMHQRKIQERAVLAAGRTHSDRHRNPRDDLQTRWEAHREPHPRIDEECMHPACLAEPLDGLARRPRGFEQDVEILREQVDDTGTAVEADGIRLAIVRPF